jgi:hypothetical protein
MWEFLATIENSAFSTWIRESPSVLGYTTVLALHSFGMAFLVGFSAMVSLRILGFAPFLPLGPMEKFFRVMIGGFWLNAVTGLVLLSLTPQSFFTNAVFGLKMLFVGASVVCLRALRKEVFSDPANLGTRPVPMKGRRLAIISLTLWGMAITAGRLTAYSATTVWQSSAAVLTTIVVLLVVRHIGARLLGLSTAQQAHLTASSRS